MSSGPLAPARLRPAFEVKTRRADGYAEGRCDFGPTVRIGDGRMAAIRVQLNEIED